MSDSFEGLDTRGPMHMKRTRMLALLRKHASDNGMLMLTAVGREYDAIGLKKGCRPRLFRWSFSSLPLRFTMETAASAGADVFEVIAFREEGVNKLRFRKLSGRVLE